MPNKPYYVMNEQRGATVFPSLKELRDWMLTQTRNSSVTLKKIDRIWMPHPFHFRMTWVPVYETVLSGETYHFTPHGGWLEEQGVLELRDLEDWKKG